MEKMVSETECEAIIEVALEAVYEQHVFPMLLALGTVTAAVCRDPETAGQVAAALRKQAESCPDGVAGRVFLESLADLAAGPPSPDPDAVSASLRNALRLISGRKR